MQRLAALCVTALSIALYGCEVEQNLTRTSGDTGNTPTKTTISLSWTAPTQREDGSLLEEREIYAYEIKYRRVGASQFERVLIMSEDLNIGPHTSYQLADLKSNESYEILLATIDRDGLRSDYISPSK